MQERVLVRRVGMRDVPAASELEVIILVHQLSHRCFHMPACVCRHVQSHIRQQTSMCDGKARDKSTHQKHLDRDCTVPNEVVEWVL